MLWLVCRAWRAGVNGRGRAYDITRRRQADAPLMSGRYIMKLAALAAVALVGTTLAVAPTQEAKACGPACVVGAAILGTFALATVATAATYPGYYGYGRGYYPGSYPGYYGYYGA